MAQDNPFYAFIKRYQRDPAGFVRECLGVQPESYQVEILEAINRHELRISVRSSHGVGKTATIAWAMIHTLIFECGEGVKIICTAPSSGTLFDGLMAEVKTWITRLDESLQSLFEVTTDHIRMAAMPHEAFISARTSSRDSPEALAGIHAARVLIIADEASGIHEEVFRAAGGSMSTHNATTVLIGNPTRNSGLFFDSHHTLSDMWLTFHVSAFQSKMVSQDFIDSYRKQYGETSNEYRIRVLGEFPLDDGHSYIPRNLVEDAMARTRQVSRLTPEVWGLDVARFGGDRTCLARRQGVVVHEVMSWDRRDLMATVGLVKNLWDNTPEDRRPLEIMVDEIGMGSGVLDRLIEMDLPAVGVNVAESSGSMGTGNRLRDELWYRLKEALMTHKLCLPFNQQLLAEQTAPMATYTSNGKLKIESKDEMKRRGLRSPDIADAVNLTFASNASPLEVITGGARARGYYRRGSLKRNLHAVV